MKSTFLLLAYILGLVTASSFLGFEPNPKLFPLSVGRKLFTPDVWGSNMGLYQEIFRAGVGYSLKRRDLTLPMFMPGQMEILEKEVGSFSRYSNVDEMLTSIYFNQKEAGAMMYSHREAGDVLYRDFFNENTHSAVSLSNKVYVKASIGSSLDLDFQEALRMLPEKYDELAYSEFCDLWGCSLVIDAFFGGAVESQVSLRFCSSVPNSDLQKDMEIAIATGKFPDMSYSRFTNTKRVNIVGGNPEISDIPSRISTFDENPVLVSASLVPLHKYLRTNLQEKRYQVPEYLLVNLEKAYNLELGQMVEVLGKMKEEGKKKATEDLASRKVYHAISNNAVYGYGCMAVRPSCLQLAHRPHCRTDACVRVGETHVSVGATETVLEDSFLGYVIDISRLSDGSIQSTFKQRNILGESVILSQGPPTKYGCTNYGKMWGDVTLTQYVCSNCQPSIRHEGVDEYLDCVCPEF